MNERRVRNDVLTPCPGCGKRFDVNGCMTFAELLASKGLSLADGEAG